MKRVSKELSIAVLAGAAAWSATACGNLDSANDIGDGRTCSMHIIDFTPALPRVHETVTAKGILSGDAVGFDSYHWRVFFDDALVTEDSTGESISFDVSRPGVYWIELSGSRGERACHSDTDALTATADGAVADMYRLLAIPAADHNAARKPSTITVYGGADTHLSPIILDSDVSLSGLIRDPQGAGLSAYVRATSRDGIVTEGFSDTAGAFEVRVNSGSHDVLVVPLEGVLPPQLFRDITAPTARRHFELSEGITITGSVVVGAAGGCNGGPGQPVAGARISVHTDAIPSTVATTGSDGRFSVPTRIGATLAVTVVPPEPSGLPVLEVPASATLSSNAGDIDICYHPDHSSRSVAVPIRQSDGVAPAPAGTRITWIAAPIDDAAVATRGPASVTARGSLRRSQVVGASGLPHATALPNAVYDAIIEPIDGAGPEQSPAVHRVDLSAGQDSPQFLALARPVTVTGVTESLAGVRVTARPAGL
ncbi:MAG: hypothetical protein MJE77_01565, partial [Proteobacteria bacterium]|nr:hypothetical protein [Pseudomonadota bacterium]